jgi:hypothetical protein
MVLTVLPLVIALLALAASHLPQPWEALSLLENVVIPAVWIAALLLGIVTVAALRRSRWKWAGIAAIVVTVIQAAGIVTYFAVMLSLYPI